MPQTTKERRRNYVCLNKFPILTAVFAHHNAFSSANNQYTVPVFSSILRLLDREGKNKMRAISVALPALTWQFVRNISKPKLVLPGTSFTRIAIGNREAYRSKED
jgi:hypothetical protein